MATVTTLQKIGVLLKLDNGLTPSGARKTVSMSFPAINKAAFDADKAMAIEILLAPVLSKSVVQMLKTEVSSLQSEE